MGPDWHPSSTLGLALSDVLDSIADPIPELLGEFLGRELFVPSAAGEVAEKAEVVEFENDPPRDERGSPAVPKNPILTQYRTRTSRHRSSALPSLLSGADPVRGVG